MNYYEAAKIRKKGFADLMTDKLTSGQGVFSSVRSTLSDRSKARSMAFKEKFDPLNIAKVLTGGSNLAPAMLGRLLGRKSSDINYFAGKKEYTPRRESSYFNNYTAPSMSSGGSQKATRVLQKMLSFMEKSRTDDMQEQDTLDSFREMNENMREDRHKEVMDVFIEATNAKVRRRFEKHVAKEAKKREREAKKAEKETSKDTGGKGAADAADAAKKAKDAPDAADAAKKAKDTADAAKKAKDAADAAKKAKDAADAAKKAKDAADSAKKAKDAADAADAAKKAKDAADSAKKAKDAADAKRIKDAADAKRIKDAADAKRAADTAKKQESVPKNKSAEKVKETKSEAPSATPSRSLPSASTAAKVGTTIAISATAKASMKGEQGVASAEQALKPVTDEKVAKRTGVPIGVPKIGAATPDLQNSTSYGLFGINNIRSKGKDGLPIAGSSSIDSFNKMFPNFGLPDAGSPTEPEKSKTFNEAWWNLARSKPEEMLQAQLQWFNKTFDEPSKKLLAENLPANIANDPGVQLFMTDRRIQYGPGIARNAFTIGKDAKTPEEFIKIVSDYDKKNLRTYFKNTSQEDYNKLESGLLNRIEHRAKMSLEILNSGEGIDNLSKQNADIKKDMSKGSGSVGPVIIQNNNTTQAKTNIHRASPQEQLNPTMRH